MSDIDGKKGKVKRSVGELALLVSLEHLLVSAVQSGMFAYIYLVPA